MKAATKKQVELLSVAVDELRAIVVNRENERDTLMKENRELQAANNLQRMEIARLNHLLNPLIETGATITTGPALDPPHAADCHCNRCIGAPAGLPSEEVKFANP